MQTIPYPKVLQELHSGQVFELVAVKYDRRRGGGALLRVQGMSTQAIGPAQSEPKKNAKNVSPEKRAENYTRKVVVCINGMPTTNVIDVHPPLILMWNGKKVTR